MIEKLVKEHQFSVILILFFTATLLNSIECLEVAIHKDNYTKMTGTIIDKYEKRYGSGKRGKTNHYLSVSFEYQGETLYINGLRSSFWEKEGDTVSFYMDSDGNVVDGSFYGGCRFYFYACFARSVYRKINHERGFCFCRITDTKRNCD